MVPRLSGQNSNVFQGFFVSQFSKETWIQRKQHQIQKFVLKASEPCQNTDIYIERGLFNTTEGSVDLLLMYYRRIVRERPDFLRRILVSY